MTNNLRLEDEDGEEVKLPGLPPNTKNYMTPACYRRLLDQRAQLVNVESSVGQQVMAIVPKMAIINTANVG